MEDIKNESRQKVATIRDLLEKILSNETTLDSETILKTSMELDEAIVQYIKSTSKERTEDE